MREILFRGKRLDNGEWTYGSFIPDLLEVYQNKSEKWLGDWGFIKPFGKTKEERLMVEVDRDTVGQYIGATDKLKKKLFDGDLVVTKYGRVCLVIWHSGAHCWDLLPVGRLNCKVPDRYDLWASENLEKIGNRWDNPELLEATSI